MPVGQFSYSMMIVCSAGSPSQSTKSLEIVDWDAGQCSYVCMMTRPATHQIEYKPKDQKELLFAEMVHAQKQTRLAIESDILCRTARTTKQGMKFDLSIFNR